MNWMLVPTLVLTYTFFGGGIWLWRHARTWQGKVGVLLVGLLFAAVGVLIPGYYLKWFQDAPWYCQFRSWPLSELSAAGVGLLAGLMSVWIEKYPLVTRPFLLAILTLGIIAPYLKPVLAPLQVELETKDSWRDGVCLQSTSATCGPASAATLLRAAGIPMSEAQIARECHTYSGGTENWYLARLFRRQGFDVEYVKLDLLSGALPVPSIAGVKVGGAGHFVALIAETDTTYLTGDPLVGRHEYRKEDILKSFQFTGFFMKVTKRVR